MTKDEALKMAIEALDTLMMEKDSVYQKAIQACKKALEQPAQEPVAWMCTDNYDEVVFLSDKTCIECQPIYTHPIPSWQGLSDDEILNLIHEYAAEGDVTFVRAIEAMLKEKNNG